MTTTKEAALKYVRFGWPVFPCRPYGKQPITTNGLHDATTDPTRVARIFENWPTANIGVRTGAISDLVVLDVDGDDGYESLRHLERQHGDLPRTASVKTPRGGQHFYFKHPGQGVRNSAGQLGTGLDVRGDGGYVIAPPSEGANGYRYEPDERAPLQPAPDWLCTMICNPGPQTKRGATPASEWTRLVAEGPREGERNQSLTRLVGHLLNRDVRASVALELLLAVNATHCHPPLPDDEVERIVRSISGLEVKRRKARNR